MSFSSPLAAIIRSVIGPLSRYAQHPAKVVSQASDGTVSVSPDSPEVPSLDAVPLALGLPGIRVKVGPGTRVRLSFASGNPSTPEVSLWEGDGLLELELDASVKVVVKAPQVLLGGPGASQAFVLGTTYRTAESTCNTAESAYYTAAAAAWAAVVNSGPLAAIPPIVAACNAAATAATAAATAVDTLEGGAANYLSTTVRGQ